MKTHPRATGNTADRLARSFPWRVVSAEGKQLAGCQTKDKAEELARVFNEKRLHKVRVIAKGER